jgi:hypothetical protein
LLEHLQRHGIAEGRLAFVIQDKDSAGEALQDCSEIVLSLLFLSKACLKLEILGCQLLCEFLRMGLKLNESRFQGAGGIGK